VLPEARRQRFPRRYLTAAEAFEEARPDVGHFDIRQM
jgi:hypothetical protein